MTLPPWLRGARAAVTFLTRVPVGGWPYVADDWRWASGHFPLVGAGIGAAIGAVFALALPLSPLAAAGLALAFGLLLTGGFHEDGLADSADALGGGYEPARVLEILKDSRIGAFGGLAITASLLVRAALIAALAAAAPVALIIAHTVSRATPVGLMMLMPYATDDAHARSRQIARAGPAQCALAAAWTAAILLAAVAWTPVTPRAALAAAVVALAITAVAGWRFHRRVGGITGDFCGATQQLCETGVLVTLLAVTS